MRFAALLFLWLSLATAVDQSTRAKLANITLRLYTNKTIDEYTTVLATNAKELLCKIDTRKRTVLYIFGWLGTPNETSVETVIRAYLKRQDHTVILVDYQEIAALSYAGARKNVDGVGKCIAIALNELVAGGLNASTIRVVGHSLGGQVAGFIQKHLNFPLARITALDPAGPGFSPPFKHLSSDCAEFVDVIHTDMTVFGYPRSTGSVDFYPNGGARRQPGCKSSEETVMKSCSHHRSWHYYVESLRNENAFVGINCESYSKFKRGLCTSKVKIVMGYAVPKSASGNVYLQTNRASPFGLGNDGATYKPRH